MGTELIYADRATDVRVYDLAEWDTSGYSWSKYHNGYIVRLSKPSPVNPFLGNVDYAQLCYVRHRVSAERIINYINSLARTYKKSVNLNTFLDKEEIVYKTISQREKEIAEEERRKYEEMHCVYGANGNKKPKTKTTGKNTVSSASNRGKKKSEPASSTTLINNLVTEMAEQIEKAKTKVQLEAKVQEAENTVSVNDSVKEEVSADILTGTATADKKESKRSKAKVKVNEAEPVAVEVKPDILPEHAVLGEVSDSTYQTISETAVKETVVEPVKATVKVAEPVKDTVKVAEPVKEKAKEPAKPVEPTSTNVLDRIKALRAKKK